MVHEVCGDGEGLGFIACLHAFNLLNILHLHVLHVFLDVWPQHGGVPSGFAQACFAASVCYLEAFFHSQIDSFAQGGVDAALHVRRKRGCAPLDRLR